MSTVIVLALWFLPTLLRGFAIGLLIVGAFAVVVAHAQQQTRTTCYDSGSTRICETFDGMGNVTSKSRCYQSGRDTRCDTRSINDTMPLPVPFAPKGDRTQR